MIIDILTSKTRPIETTNQTVEFWKSIGWTPRLWDNTGKPCGVGRNQMMQDFYASDREWCIICDDDITLYPHRFQTQLFMDTFDAFTQSDVDLFSLNSNNEMRRQMQYTWWDTTDQLLWHRDATVTKWFAIRKTDQQYWWEEWYGLEDLDFALQHLADGLTVARMPNVFLREQGFKKSSLFTSDQQRRDGLVQGRQGIAHKWGFSTKNKSPWIADKWNPRGAWTKTIKGWVCSQDNKFVQSLQTNNTYNNLFEETQ
tara:strand:+ start:2380 stop:3147 length:768 start_codon:yes stop_codon:yes gene_type:complete